MSDSSSAPRSPLNGLRDIWENGLGQEVRRSAIAFLCIWAIFFAACMVLPDLRHRLSDMMFATLGGLNVTDAHGRVSALGLFFNNIQATAVIMLYGLIPFIQLPALALGMNAMMLGVMAAWYAAEDVSFLAYVAGVLPHGVLELPALFLSFGMGLYICAQVTRRCRKDKSALSVWGCMTAASQVLITVLVPLLFIASFIEAYVTPLAASLFL